MTGISLDELAAIEPRVIARSEAISLLVEEFGVDPHRFDGIPTLCVQLRLRSEFNRREENSGLKLEVLEDAELVREVTFLEPELVGVAS